MLLYFHRAFLFVLDHHPEIQEQIENILQQFIQVEQNRTQVKLAELPTILALSTVSKKINFDDLVGPYLDELHDRNVFLIMKQKQDFDKLTDTELSNDYFNQVFESVREGFDLLQFFHYFNHYVIMKETKARHLESLIEEYDKRYSRLYSKIEDNLQQKIKNILKVRTYGQFYKAVGLEVPDVQTINRIQRDAIKRSVAKYYHGGVDLAI